MTLYALVVILVPPQFLVLQLLHCLAQTVDLTGVLFLLSLHFLCYTYHTFIHFDCLVFNFTECSFLQSQRVDLVVFSADIATLASIVG